MNDSDQAVEGASPRDQVTRLLSLCSEGDDGAFVELIPLVYDDLRGIAHRRLRSERTGHTLNTTAVVHEAYLQLVNQATATWRDRAHFFAVAARVIRHVLIDYARARKTHKRAGTDLLVPMQEDLVGEEPRTVELLALEEALQRLAKHDPSLEKIVECRFFGGMTMADTAAALGVSKRTAERQWTRARAYLYGALEGSRPDLI